jgi:hypothetical protein
LNTSLKLRLPIERIFLSFFLTENPMFAEMEIARDTVLKPPSFGMVTTQFSHVPISTWSLVKSTVFAVGMIPIVLSLSPCKIASADPTNVKMLML